MTVPDAGLCGRCLHARRVMSARGSEFVRCGRSDTDPTFARYPVLPMRACRGYEPAPDAPASAPPGDPGAVR